VQIVGAAAPSLRIDNAESGPTKRAGLGISTAANNFIQGSVDRDFLIFDGSTTASPILFGIHDTTNVAEAARISAARNFLIGTTTDGGQKLQVNGTARASNYYLDGMTAGAGALYYSAGQNRVTLANYNASGILRFEVDGGTDAATIIANGNFGIGTTAPARKLDVNGVTRSTAFDVFNGSALSGFLIQQTLFVGDASTNLSLVSESGKAITFYTNGSTTQRALIYPIFQYWYCCA